jgi:large subunit ribosomal protein L10
MLVGPTALAFVNGDAALAAKALNDIARQLNLLDFKGGLLNGTALSADDVRSIARLPSREVLNAQLVGTIAAPLTGLVRGLNALITGLAIQLQAIADQGLVTGEAPAAAEEPAGVAGEEPAEAAAEEPAAAAAEEPAGTAAAAEEPAGTAAAAEEPAAAAAEEPAAAAATEPAAAEEPPAAEPAPDKPEEPTQAASDAAPSDE